MLDYSDTTFGIGAGRPSKEGTPLQIPISPATAFATLVFTAAGNILTSAAHGLVSGQVVYLTGADLAAPLAENTAYWVIYLSVNTFSLASTYANSLVPTAITLTDAGTGTQTLHYGEAATLSPVLEVLSSLNADYFYLYDDSAGLSQCSAPTVSVPDTPSASYTGLTNGAVNFKIAAIRDRGNVGVNIDNPNAPVKGRASSATAVVVPNNKTVKITFPALLSSEQTHWAVFATKEGFGGTGAFYRLGWRQTSDADETWYFGISEETVVAHTSTTGARTLEFDFRTGDLLPEVAWTEDYPPQAGTHCIRLENVMIVFGTLDGTVAQVSLPNFFESYNPFHLLYFPEAVTTVLHRPVDNYAFVACRNSIHAVQYVGYRGGDLPSATVTTITPEIGVENDGNWALGGGNICIFVEGTGLVMMSADGSIDFEFGKEVIVFTRGWPSTETGVGLDPTTRSFVCANNGQSVCYCLQTGTWSTPLYLTDAGLSSATTWESAIISQGKMICTLEASSLQTAYLFDDNTSTTRTPTSAVSQWETSPLGLSGHIN